MALRPVCPWSRARYPLRIPSKSGGRSVPWRLAFSSARISLQMGTAYVPSSYGQASARFVLTLTGVMADRYGSIDSSVRFQSS